MNAQEAEKDALAHTPNVIEFAQGQRDCRQGVEYKKGKGESYDQGYGFEYELQEMRGRK